MTIPSEALSGSSSSTNWLLKNKEDIKASVTASLGMILPWDVDSELSQIDKYFHSALTSQSLLDYKLLHQA